MQESKTEIDILLKLFAQTLPILLDVSRYDKRVESLVQNV